MKWEVHLRLLSMVALLASCHVSSSAVTPGGYRGCDRLSPAASALTHPDPGAARHQAIVAGTLLSGVPQPNSENVLTGAELFMVMVKEDPRWPQEAVYILRTPPRPSQTEYRVVHARAKEQIQFQNGAVGVDIEEAPLDAEVVRALEGSWGMMALSARWPNREGNIARMKWAGTFFTFDYRGDNVYGQGDTVSPQPGTCSASLVNLGELLIQFAGTRSETTRAKIRVELLRQSRMLGERAAVSNDHR